MEDIMPGGIKEWNAANRRIINCRQCGDEKEVPYNNKGFCSILCANTWRKENIYGGKAVQREIEKIDVLPKLTLEMDPSTGHWRWRCWCGESWARTPHTTAPCSHADMGRLASTVGV
jgi:hypothetical protein